MPAFVLEIGTEELPARFLDSSENELGDRFKSALAQAGLDFSGLRVCSTPRRLALYVEQLAETASIREEVVTGPPIKAAFDMGGRPTRAAEGFAKTHGMELEDTFTLDTEKGPYLALRKTLGGEDALSLLANICPAVISSLPFPKRMHWGSGNVNFARPVRWILALLGGTVVPFGFGTVEAMAHTFGHRVYGAGPFALSDATQYFEVMARQCGVVVESSQRRSVIRQTGDALAAEHGGTVLWKESLLDEVQGLCEHPQPILGSFDPSYFEVPREALLTSMESHQKSFGIEGNDGKLLPHFLTVLNLNPENRALVKKGWERVLRARLEDARFFWKTDLAAGSCDPWLQALDSVIFLAPLGSMGDKTRRIEQLCGWLAENIQLVGERQEVEKESAMRAGRLSKADLVSEMVKEFDTLQGIMGGIYASRFGESDQVAAAVAEQYLPAGPESPVPSTLYGALLSIADKADTLAGCFGLGMIPTGAADPYALRRAALGIARIAEEKALRFDVSALFKRAIDGYGQRDWKLPPEKSLPRLEEFFTLRLKNHFLSKGGETLLTEAVLLAGAADVWAASGRLAAITEFSKSGDFGSSVLTFKRAANIIRKQGQDNAGVPLDGKYRHDLLTDDAEKALAAELERLDPLFAGLWEANRYYDFFLLLRELSPTVDAFFEQVMVMCEDEAVRKNRLNLLQALVNRLGRMADFAALQI